MRIGKKYYYIGEVADEVGLPEYILRTWEKKFEFLSPITTNKGTRKYTGKDINLLKKIKFLVREEKYTLPGARRKLLELRNKMFDDFNEEEFRVQIRGGDTGNTVESKSKINQAIANIAEIVDKGISSVKKEIPEEKAYKTIQPKYIPPVEKPRPIPVNPENIFPVTRKEIISDLLDILKILR